MGKSNENISKLVFRQKAKSFSKTLIVVQISCTHRCVRTDFDALKQIVEMRLRRPHNIDHRTNTISSRIRHREHVTMSIRIERMNDYYQFYLKNLK